MLSDYLNKIFQKFRQPAYDETDMLEDLFCPNCQASLNKQRGFSEDLKQWKCLSCEAVLTNPDAEEFDNNIIWYCDQCGACLNEQEDFQGDLGTWSCKQCGYQNEINDSEIYLTEDEYEQDKLNPTKGMADEDILALSCYDEVRPIDKKGKAILVQNLENGQFYVRKTLDLYDLSVLQELKDHPIAGMPKIEELFEARYFLTMIEEYIPGITLEELLSHGVLESQIAQNFMLQLCDIVGDLHQMEPAIIHRDIKPSNMVITKTGKLYLLDVDAAKKYNPDEYQDTVLLGTKNYAAPEQYGFGASSVRTDIYSMGVLLNVMLTGTYPRMQLADGPLGDIVRKCTKMDVEDRYRSVAELRESLTGV